MGISFVTMIVGVTYMISAMTVYLFHTIAIEELGKNTKKIKVRKSFRFWLSCLPAVNTLFLLIFFFALFSGKKKEQKK